MMRVAALLTLMIMALFAASASQAFVSPAGPIVAPSATIG